MIPTSDHNEALTGDTLYSAFLNYEWREIVLPFVIAGMEKIAASIDDESDRQEFEVRYGAMIDDFYNEEIPVGEAVGSIKLWGSSSIPDTWMHCDGQSLDEDDYPELFALIGTNFGSAGAGFFNLPNTGFKFALGSDDADTDIGDFGGEINHTLTLAEIPAHTHTIAKSTGSASQVARAVIGNNTASTDQSTGSAGGGGAHNNMPPYIRLVYIIKVLP